jgi:alpha-L-fucosidase
MKKQFFFLLLLLCVGSSCSVKEPESCGPIPSSQQLVWQKMEMYAFVHFSMNTFTDIEWGYGDVDPQQFNPSQVNCEQWVKLFKKAGLKGVILTAKHHDGFCLWPSKYTDYSVKASPWRDGKGDLVRELADACHKHGLKLGLYLSPWDRNRADYGTASYITYFRNQLTELLTNYGDIFEIWFDGANGGDGYYGGANEVRSVNRKTYYDWENTYKLVYKHQPNAILFSDAGPGCRWCGNEEGWVGKRNWSPLRKDEFWPGNPNYKELRYGHEDGNYWVPAEVDVSVRPGWFYHASEDHKVKSLEEMVNIYYHSVGRNANLLLNFPVDKRGLVHEEDAKRILELAQVIRKDFAHDLAEGKELKVSSVRENAGKFAPEQMLDSSLKTYWAPEKEDASPWIEVLLGKTPIAFNRLLLQENIALGQRVASFKVEAWQKGAWQLLAQESTIGYKRILRLPTTLTTKVRISFLRSKATPLLAKVGVYNAPKLLIAPRITRDEQGFVQMHSADKELKIYYTLDEKDPTTASSLYTEPFKLTNPAEVKAFAFDPISGKKSRVTAERFDITPMHWKVLYASKPAETVKLFDGNVHTAYSFKSKQKTNELVIDLGKNISLVGFMYLPDQSRWAKGIISKYRFMISKNNKQWKCMNEGEFSNIKNNPIQQIKRFPRTQCRYVKLVVLRTIDGADESDVSEFSVLTQ